MQTVRRPELWLVNELILRRASAMEDRGLRVGKSEPTHAGWWGCANDAPADETPVVAELCPGKPTLPDAA